MKATQPLTDRARRLDDALHENRLRRRQLLRRRPTGKAASERHHVAELAQRG